MRSANHWLALLALGASGCGAAAAPPPHQAAQPPSALAVAELVKVATPLSLPAQLYVERDALLYARSAGVIESVSVDLGARVAAGQTVARLESVDQEIALARAEDAFGSASRLATRQRELTQRGVATIADSEQVESQLHQAELELRQARRDVQLTRIVAPFAGVVSARYARIGRLAARGDSLFRITAMAPLLAAVQVPESAAVSLRVGTSARIRARGVSSSARVVHVAPVVDGASGTRQIVLEVAAARGLVPGTAVTAALASAERSVLALPRDAVGPDGLAMVWDGTRAVARPVEVGAALTGDRIEIVKGLSAGERVLRPGR